jgi:hypothetical protein
MKNLITVTLLTMALSLPVSSFAQYGAPGAATTGGSSPAGNAASNMMITGTVVSVDQSMGKITVVNSLNGAQKDVTVLKRDDLENIQKGDKVTVTLQNDDSTKATNVIKQ